MKLLGAVVFAGFGVLFIVLALTGNADTAPGFQRTIGTQMRTFASYVDGVPNVITLPLLLALAAGFTYALMREDRQRDEREKG